MKIERKNYSRGPWRLLTDDGNDVYYNKPMDHPDLGMTWVTMPVCGETKAECLEATLSLLSQALNRLQELNATNYPPRPRRIVPPIDAPLSVD